MGKPSSDVPVAEDVVIEPKKLPYTRPELKVFGSVSRWTMGTRTQFTDGGNTRLFRMFSDRNAKENIIQVGWHPLGIGLYLFDYKPQFREQWGSGRQFGVMADEVEAVTPEAVSVHADGYKMVNYTMLGISHPNH
jgi:hypothetical protein